MVPKKQRPPGVDPRTRDPLAILGGMLYALGVFEWVSVVPINLLGAAINGTTDSTTNELFTVLLVLFALVCGAGTLIICANIGMVGTTSKVVLGGYLLLLTIGIGANIWFVTLTGSPPNRCEVPPCG
ncbi:hypothetical protein SAMN04487819_101165 [Actinopolyspora alba]|uniref:Uncharacterized protein n=1 Tax=Actinopolyspora alba TaxID=673379 RepID=A0A1I1TPJ9_9ACTN|nr:hypothetical protein [Actinopolyspora alba]SFD59128.1 hypothetical protein SAMN04487819_101165 [Actinopolyspora alba]